MTIKLPELEPSTRNREYDLYSPDEIEEVVYAYMFLSYTHRKLDNVVLNLDPTVSKGYQSMGILHFLGLRKAYKGFFSQFTISEAIRIMNATEAQEGLTNIALILETFNSKKAKLFEISSKPLIKQVGKSQFQDGIRINQEFFSVFNDRNSLNYVERGSVRKIYILFNEKIFIGNYRHENQSKNTLHLERIGFDITLIKEFEKVFPKKQGLFEVIMGKDDCHFMINVDIDINREDIKQACIQFVSASLPKEDGERDKVLLEMIESENDSAESEVEVVTTSSKSYKSNPLRKERLKILYDYRCQICGTQIKKAGWYSSMSKKMKYKHQMSDVHHIIPLHKGGFDISRNMICVCPNCHRRLHTGEFKLYEQEDSEIKCINTISREKIGIISKHKIDVPR